MTDNFKASKMEYIRMINPFSFFKDQSAVSVEEVKEALDNKADLILVDVRTPEEYAQGHIKASVLVPVQVLPEQLEKLPNKDELLYIYCRRGIRGANAVRILRESGYTNVHNMSGGIEAWMSKDYPVING